MSDSLRLRIPTADDRDAFARLIGLAFAVSEQGARSFVDRLPTAYGRIAGTPAVACVALLPFGQWFGGRRVEMTGIHAVGIAPEARGQRLAQRMMARAVSDLADEGVVLSCLFASTPTLYRAVGYEHAGTRHEISLRLREIARSATRPGRTMATPVVVLDETDATAIERLHRDFGQHFDGAIEREAYQWRRTAEPGGVRAERLGIRRADGELEGCAMLLPEQENGQRELAIVDVAFRTAAAGQRLRALIADFAPLIPTGVLFGGPAHPLLSLLQQHAFDAKLTDLWMLRVVHLPNAIAQRGHPISLRVGFRIELDDPIVAANAGPWVVEIAGGRGGARRPTRVDDQPLLRLDARGLATIYSGFRTPATARLLGLVDGNPEAMEMAGAAFAGAGPWMTDRF